VAKALPVFRNDTSYPLASFSAPTTYGAGIEHFSGALWVGNSSDNKVYKMSPTDGRLIRSFASGAVGLAELAKDRAGNLWVHDYNNWNPRARLLRVGTAAWMSQSATGRLYGVEAGTNLMTGFNLILGAYIPATPPVNVHTDNTAAAEQKFYRVTLD